MKGRGEMKLQVLPYVTVEIDDRAAPQGAQGR